MKFKERGVDLIECLDSRSAEAFWNVSDSCASSGGNEINVEAERLFHLSAELFKGLRVSGDEGDIVKLEEGIFDVSRLC